MIAGRRPVAEVRALRTRAAAELPPQLLALAATLGLTVARVTIRDQRSRWGSCSPKGHIALNFRLLLMPSDVREYVLVHELMHLKQPNHSRRFWRLVEGACPGFRDAERWLRKHGPSLFW
jgi:predicted metal-dependent hydrolase